LEADVSASAEGWFRSANHQSCVWHLWRIIWREITKLTSMAALESMGEAAKTKGKELRQELLSLVHAVVDAAGLHQAEIALANLVTHPLGKDLVRKVGKALDETLVHLSAYNQGLIRVAPEWCWRDFRLRLSRGRNHGSEERLERAALLWAIYRNFTPAQERSERKRHYRRPGLSPLEVAGAQPETVSYLDALAI
jgi:predicted XRE-type DNA-binding protein